MKGAVPTTSGREVLCARPSVLRRSRATTRVQAARDPRDPEGLFANAPPLEGIIEKRLFQKAVAGDKEFAAKMKAFAAEAAEAAAKRRAGREPPPHDDQLAEYFLSTEAEDMDFEVARCRARLTPAFFSALDRAVGMEKLAPDPDAERVAELEGLREFLKSAVAEVDAAAAALASPSERLKRLLEARDKKACLLEMVAANEVDKPLLDLLDTNIKGAREGGQDAAADFMQKVRDAAARYATTK